MNRDSAPLDAASTSRPQTPHSARPGRRRWPATRRSRRPGPPQRVDRRRGERTQADPTGGHQHVHGARSSPEPCSICSCARAGIGTRRTEVESAPATFRVPARPRRTSGTTRRCRQADRDRSPGRDGRDFLESRPLAGAAEHLLPPPSTELSPVEPYPPLPRTDSGSSATSATSPPPPCTRAGAIPVASARWTRSPGRVDQAHLDLAPRSGVHRARRINHGQPGTRGQPGAGVPNAAKPSGRRWPPRCRHSAGLSVRDRPAEAASRAFLHGTAITGPVTRTPCAVHTSAGATRDQGVPIPRLRTSW